MEIHAATSPLQGFPSDEDFIRELLAIDALVYSPELRCDFAATLERYQFNREMFLLLFDDKKIIGYFSFLPIKDELYQRIIAEDHLFDNDIPLEMFERYEKEKNLNLYVISITLHPQYQGLRLSAHFATAFSSFLEQKQRDGFRIQSVLATVVSESGKRFTDKLNFQTVKLHNSGYIVKKLAVS